MLARARARARWWFKPCRAEMARIRVSSYAPCLARNVDVDKTCPSPVGTTRNTELHCFRSFLWLLRHADDIVSSVVLRKHLARVPREATWAITRFAERKKLRAWLLTYCVTGISRMPEYTSLLFLSLFSFRSRIFWRLQSVFCCHRCQSNVEIIKGRKWGFSL